MTLRRTFLQWLAAGAAGTLFPFPAPAQADVWLRARKVIASGAVGRAKYASAIVSADGRDRIGRALERIDDIALALDARPRQIDINTEFGGCVVLCRFADGVRASLAVCRGADDSAVVRGTHAALHIRRNGLWLEHGGALRLVGPV